MVNLLLFFSIFFLSFAAPEHDSYCPEISGYHTGEANLLYGNTTVKSRGLRETDRPVPKGRTTSVKRVNTWPGGIIPFRIADEMPPEVRERIMIAISKWEAQTPLRFRNLDSLNLEDPRYFARFYYIGARGCSAHVGMRDQKQSVNITRVNISDRCKVGAIMHEIGHTVGLYHEHQRPGRDEVIKIHWDNIKADKRKSFTLRSRATADSIDFESIMMYGSFSTLSVEKGKPVMTKHNGETWKKQRERLSEGDLWKLRELYPEIF